MVVHVPPALVVVYHPTLCNPICRRSPNQRGAPTAACVVDWCSIVDVVGELCDHRERPIVLLESKFQKVSR